MMADLQALRVNQTTNTSDKEFNPFVQPEMSQNSPNSQPITPANPTTFDPNQTQLKLSFPTFDDDDPTGWIFKAEQYFTFKNITPPHQAILHRFGPTDYDDPFEALSCLKQTSTVASYQETFEKLSHCVDGLPENFLVGCFIAGVKDEVRLDVRIKQPRTLSDAINAARLIEDRNQLQRNCSLRP
ncbi:hypothetical protein Q3G72_018732 [Acer saccharum]|nr:hypothetical protein Q3G72_018732 [Acer saccharum]